MEELKDRVIKFKCIELPGQPMMMHMGTSYLVNDLWSALERQEKEIEAQATEIEALRQDCKRHFNRKLLYRQDASDLRDKVATLTAENAALRADAERYRFIFAESDRVDPVCAVVWKKGNVRNSSEWVDSVGGEWLSKELDAAIGEKK